MSLQEIWLQHWFIICLIAIDLVFVFFIVKYYRLRKKRIVFIEGRKRYDNPKFNFYTQQLNNTIQAGLATTGLALFLYLMFTHL